MLWLFSRDVLRDPEPAAGGGGLTPPPAGGSGTPPAGGNAQPQFVTADQFSEALSVIRGLNTQIEEFKKGVLTPDKLTEFGLLSKQNDGTYKPFQSAPSPAGDGKGKKPEGDDPVAKELKDLKDQLAAKDRALEEQQKAVAERERDSAVVAALNEAGAVKANRDYFHLRDKVVRNEAGQYVVKGKDGYGRDIEIPVTDAAKQFLKDNPELLRAQSQAGSGTTPGGAATQPGSGPGRGQVIPRSQYSNMQWFIDNKKKFESGEFVMGD